MHLILWKLFFQEARSGGLISELNRSENGVHFLGEYSCERYFRYNKELLFRENTKDILHRIQELGE